jgi:hypothetical protein
MARSLGRLVALLLTASLLLPVQAFAWGGAGHRLIGDLAYAELTPRGRAFVDRLIAQSPNQEGAGVCAVASMADLSTWADCVRGARIASFDYMGALHYVNTPISAPAPTGLFCADGDCVTGAIRQAETDLARPGLSDLSRLLVLEQLAHFIEDVHQPLHVGENRDKGGNDVQIVTFDGGRARNLHALWDGDLVIAAVGPNQERLGEIRDLIKAHASEWRGQPVEEWARESFEISKTYAYPGLASPPTPDQGAANGGRISQAYVEGAEPIVRVQLARAAVRLAEAINRAAADQRPA